MTRLQDEAVTQRFMLEQHENDDEQHDPCGLDRYPNGCQKLFNELKPRDRGIGAARGSNITTFGGGARMGALEIARRARNLVSCFLGLDQAARFAGDESKPPHRYGWSLIANSRGPIGRPSVGTPAVDPVLKFDSSVSLPLR